MPIPPFSIDGIIPPFLGSNPGAPSNLMSPYEVSVAEVVAHFGTTAQRRAILAGWLEYRIILRTLGLRRGFQWLDGSFVEDKHPNDLDIVLFLQRPSKYRTHQAFEAFIQANIGLFDRSTIKQNYSLDAFYIDLQGDSDDLITLTRYFLQLFCHQRATFLWKGLLQVRQEDSRDDANLLATLRSGGAP